MTSKDKSHGAGSAIDFGLFDYHVCVRKAGSPEELRRLARQFLDEYLSELCSIREAIRRRDAQGLVAHARSLQGAMQPVAGYRCQGELLALQDYARSRKFRDASRICGLLEADIASLAGALRCVVSPDTEASN